MNLFKSLILTATFLLSFCTVFGFISYKTDSLTTLLDVRDDSQRYTLIYKFLQKQYFASSANDGNLNELRQLLIGNDVQDADIYVNLAQILIYRRKEDFKSAEKLLKLSIAKPQFNNEELLYLLHLNLAYVQTDKSDFLSAINNYRSAQKLAKSLNDERKQAVTATGMSDLYAHLQLYKQALQCLDEVAAYCNTAPNDTNLASNVIANKAEIYYNINQPDSLRHYSNLYKSIARGAAYDSILFKRHNYYSLILEKKYRDAISIIKNLLTRPGEYYKDVDNWNLAECYFQAKFLDSAQTVAALLVSKREHVSSQIKINALNLLSKIAESEGDISKANNFNRLAVMESEAYRIKLLQIADISSDIRLDQMEASYLAKAVIYKKERTILVFAIIITVLSLLVGTMFYYNIRQKHNYEKLLNQTRTLELAFINSHEVRKHLANILGICIVVDETHPDKEELLTYYEHLRASALEIDKSLQNIEKKLSQQHYN